VTAHVRDVMTEGAECVGDDDNVLVAAHRPAELQVGSVPICGNDNRLTGMLTDRDIVVKAQARDLDPATVTAGSLAEGKPVTIGADDLLDHPMQTMAEQQVRRLPVIDGDQLVGMLSQTGCSNGGTRTHEIHWALERRKSTLQGEDDE
jgi:CBS domain-containing protein